MRILGLPKLADKYARALVIAGRSYEANVRAHTRQITLRRNTLSSIRFYVKGHARVFARAPKQTGAMRQETTAVHEKAAVAKVEIKSGGYIDETLSVADAVKALGLSGDGVGGFLGVRSPEVLQGTGMHTATPVKTAR